ncbi:MAG: PIN domain-containing protein [Acidobacteria bacterium]|nr:PIN domain-containing protein [Acidobacteriota bacterium]MCA1642242.1 PIN domain-containing protein [Acidobacteriota bacterium]
MNSVFVDTSFVVALINDRNQHHTRASELANLLDGCPLLTTDAVLIEIGNALARNFKGQAVEIITDFLASEEVEIVHLHAALFASAFELYRTHTDKAWGMVDCVSFVVMQERGLVDALTNDKDFAQAGFNALMRAS